MYRYSASAPTLAMSHRRAARARVGGPQATTYWEHPAALAAASLHASAAWTLLALGLRLSSSLSFCREVRVARVSRARAAGSAGVGAGAGAAEAAEEEEAVEEEEEEEEVLTPPLPDVACPVGLW